MHAESKELSIGKLTAYTYLMDLYDLDPLSNASYGGFLKGKQKLNDRLTYHYRLEYAQQTSYGDAPIEPAFADSVSLQHLNRILEVLTSFCSHVIIDTPARCNRAALAAMTLGVGVWLIAKGAVSAEYLEDEVEPLLAKAKT